MMYTSKQLIKKAEEFRQAGDIETAGMLEHLNQLTSSYIPQLHKKMKEVGFSWWTEHYFPHMNKYTKPVEVLTEQKYDEITDIDNLVKPMDADEFKTWIEMDRYGNSCVDMPAVTNFLEIISGEAGWDDKEIQIYKSLEENKNKQQQG